MLVLFIQFKCVCVCVCVLEMQQYIDISPYCDTLGSDTVSIHIRLYRYIEYCDTYINISTSNCILIHTTDATVVHHELQIYISALIILEKGSKNQLIHT